MTRRRRRRGASCLGHPTRRSVTKAIKPTTSKCTCFLLLVVDTVICMFLSTAHDPRLSKLKDACMKLDFAWTMSGCLVTMYDVIECVLVGLGADVVDRCVRGACRNTRTIRAYKAAAWEVSFRTTSSLFFREQATELQHTDTPALGAKRSSSYLFARECPRVTRENRVSDHGGVAARPVHHQQRPGREGPRQERRQVGCGGEAASFEVEMLLEETHGGAAEAKRGQVRV